MKNLIAIIIILLFSQIIKAQTANTDYIIYGVPQYLFVNGLRIDVDIRRANENKWLVISPYIFNDNENNNIFGLNTDSDLDNHHYKKMWGAGLGLSHKRFLSPGKTNNGFYFMYGLHYKYMNFSGSNYRYNSFTGDDGLQYFNYRYTDFKTNLHSLTPTACIGVTVTPVNGLFIDFFVGMGLKYSIHTSQQTPIVKYNRAVVDYGYTGTLFVPGFRVGVSL